MKAHKPRRITSRTYARAEARLAPNMPRLVPRVHVRPTWLAGGSKVCIERRHRKGGAFVVIDCQSGEETPAFDHRQVAGDISKALGKDVNRHDLAVGDLRFGPDDMLCGFEFSGVRFIRDASGTFVRDDAVSGELKAPDGRRALARSANDLVVLSGDDRRETRLTTDGAPDHAYAKSPDANNATITLRRMGAPKVPVAVWSPDSRRILTHRLDERGVEMLHLVQSTPPSGVRPILHSYRVPFPGDEHVARSELLIFDAESGERIVVDYPPICTITSSLIERRYAWWSADGAKAYVIAPERGDAVIHLLEIDAATGATRVVLTERGATFVEAQPWLGGRPNVRVLERERQVIWYSERDGWGHLYLYDLESGALVRQLTEGPWAVREIVHIDAVGQKIYFSACGREPGRDPYYRHLYSVGFDGKDLRLLTPEDADHQVIIPSVNVLLPPDGISPDIGHHSVAPNGQWIVDCYSRVDTPPRAVLRDNSGRIVRTLIEADMAALTKSGWTWPEPFTVKARDGETDLFGVLFRPSNFDPAKRYPVIDAIYPGPHTFRVPKSSFGGEPNAMFMYASSAALAELGFIVMAVDGLGTAGRSKAFHDFSHGNLGDAGGLADHVGALSQLAERYPEIDLQRVGIWGYSAGGFAAARAILEFPGTYKVAVSSAGNHDSRAYHAAWGERYHGSPDHVSYDSQVTARLVENLTGKLLLTYGELDDNAHPCMTLQLASALIDANKDFDLMVLPNRNHGYGVHDTYYIRRVWDYFVRHLLGAEPPANYQLSPLGPFPMEA